MRIPKHATKWGLYENEIFKNVFVKQLLFMEMSSFALQEGLNLYQRLCCLKQSRWP